jgi:citrate lyase subunit alpha/citrate CoA-transferase
LLDRLGKARTIRLAGSVGPKIVDRVGCITTPGETIDAVVTEAGVAVHPRRTDLRERLQAAGLELLSIEQLRARARELKPAPSTRPAVEGDEPVVGIVEHRDGRVIDLIRRTPG